MGTKQLLLIAIGIITVGAVIAVSVDLFDIQFSGQVKDMTIKQMHNVSSFAITYWKKPEDIGGGGGSYKGFEIPQSIKEDALSWKFDTRINDNELNFFMVSKQLVYNKKPFYLTGLHQGGKLISIKLFDPEKNKWKTIFDSRYNTKYTDSMDDI